MRRTNPEAKGGYSLEQPICCVGKRRKHRLIVVANPDELGRTAALIVVQELRRKARAVLAVPTGRTPLSLYHWLVRMYSEGSASFSAVTAFNLDEFYGITADHPGSFAAYLRRELFSHVNLSPENVNLLNSMAQDVETECRVYEQRIRRAGGIDLAILGIGQNGHIAFNEPGSPPDSRTRLVRLTAQTVKDSRLFFPDTSQVPRLALTMGMGTIMEARQVLLLAAGKKKARIVAAALQGEVTTVVPASLLQQHPRLIVVVDKDAANRLVR